MLNQKALIYAADLTAKAVIYAVQNDTGRVLEIAFGDYAIPSGATAQLWIRSSKGTLSFAAGTIANDVVTVPLSASNLAEAGIAAAQLQITAGGSYIKSLPFIINIQEEANGQTITPSEETLIEQVIAEMQAQLSQQIADWQTALDNKVPQTRKVNNKALNEDITLTNTDVGAPSASDYNSFVSATESALAGKVPQTRTVNGQALSSDITLDAGDIPFTPTPDISATNVQDALASLVSGGYEHTIHSDTSELFHESFKFANGILIENIQSANVVLTSSWNQSGGIYCIMYPPISFANTFSRTPTAQISARGSVGNVNAWAWFHGGVTKTSTGNMFVGRGNNAATGTIVVMITAIGLWK